MADVGNAVRALALIMLAIACGGMLRFYLTRPKMPVWAFIAFSSWVVALGIMIIGNFNEGWNWFETPFVILGSLATLIGIWPYLERKKHS